MTTTSTNRREQAVNRSLDLARVRAEQRLGSLLSAAEALMEEGVDPTVAEVVARAGQSLRTFYQHFAGKNDLMLALLELGCEELAVALERTAAKEADAVAALQAAVALLHTANGPLRSSRRLALAQFSGQLLHSDPAAYQQVQQRIVSVLTGVVEAAAPGVDPLRTAAVLVNIIQGTARRDALLVAQGLTPLTSVEVWASVSGLVFPASPEGLAA